MPLGALLLSAWLAPAGVLSDAHMVTVELNASSRARTARHALDERYRTAWCPSSRDRDPTLELVFERPVALSRIELDTDWWPSPRRLPTWLDVLTDERTPSIGVDIDDHGGTLALDGTPVTTLRLRPTGGERCMPELLLFDADDHVVQPIHGLERAALHALPAFVLALGRSRSTDDVAGLARHIRFPLRWDHDVGDPHDGPSRFETTRYASAAALVRRSDEAPDFHDFDAGTDRRLRLVRALSSVYVPTPGTLVVATGQGGNAQWQLVWDGRRWQVDRIYGNAYHALRR